MKKIILSLAVIGIVSTIAVGATRAYFSSTSTSEGNTFRTGTLNITLDSNGIVNSTTPPTLPISLTGLYPGYNGATNGDYYYPAVANTGSMNFNWKFNLLETASTSPNGGDLNSVLNVKIEESAMGGNPWAYPAGGTFNCQNAVIWNGSYGANVTTVYAGSVSAYSGAVSMGSLAPGYGRCYRLSFSLDGESVGNAYQDASAVYTLGVNAEQVH